MAVQVRVLKGGKPVSGVKVYYSKSTIGGWGDKKTDDQGYVIFQISAGETSLLTITGKGISYEIKGYHLKNGLNEFRFGVLLKSFQKTGAICACFTLLKST